MNTETMNTIINIQNEQWCDQMMKLIENDQYEDAESLYLEYVVDDEEPEEFYWFQVNSYES